MLKRMALVLTLGAALTAGAGCAKKQAAEDVNAAEETQQVDTSAIDRAAQQISDGTIYFDFDKFALKSEYREVLKAKAELMKAYPSIRVRIEGNCDARGTQEYNLALGERRARAAYDYLVMNGVNTDQLEIISFGKERPAVAGNSEAAHSKNRRDEFNVIAK